MKLNMKVTALIYSLNNTAEVTIIEMVGNNKYLAEYDGNICAAMFNPFVGLYCVDDIHGRFPAIPPEELDDVLYELKFLGESSERQLSAYRSLGSVKYLKQLRDKELRRRKNWKLFKRIVATAISVTGITLLLWIFISGIITIVA